MIDQHVHFLSGDSPTVTLEGLKEKQEKYNFENILVTDHFELGKKEPEIPAFDYLNSLGENILVGAEIGYIKKHIEDYNQYINKYNLNTVLLSIHRNFNTGVHYYIINKYVQPEDELKRDYFQHTLEAINSNIDFDILTHMGYIFRGASILDFYNYDSEINLVLNALIDKNKVLEINTSCYTHYNPEIYEFYDHLLSLYSKLGGQNVSIGSDAHKCEEIGQNFDKAFELLKKNNFTKIAIIKNRQVTYEDIKI